MLFRERNDLNTRVLHERINDILLREYFIRVEMIKDDTGIAEQIEMFY